MIKQSDLFSEENECNNPFYNFDSNSKYLTKARDILLESLSEEDKRLIKELDEQIINVKNQISDINFLNLFSINIINLYKIEN